MCRELKEVRPVTVQPDAVEEPKQQYLYLQVQQLLSMLVAKVIIQLVVGTVAEHLTDAVVLVVVVVPQTFVLVEMHWPTVPLLLVVVAVQDTIGTGTTTMVVMVED
jgi:hypothetical protein